MNTKTLRWRSLELAVPTGALIGLCVVAPITAMADGQPRLAPETLSAKVSLADIDRSTAEGQRVAYERLQKAARRLCKDLEAMHPQSLAHYPTYIKCVDETLAQALQQLNGPALAATQRSPR